MSSKFDAIFELHSHLSDHWNTHETLSPAPIHTLIDMSRGASRDITLPEERESLRLILRVWAGRLLRIGEQFPDIDIDSVQLRPPQLTLASDERDDTSKQRGSLDQLNELGKRLKRLMDRRDADLQYDAVFGEFTSLLPGAINDAVRQQRRSRLDVLQDLTWAVNTNVMALREFMEAQGEAGLRSVSDIWVNSWEIFDLSGRFYQRTTRRNLLDGVRYCYFVRDAGQFDRLMRKVSTDRSLGGQHRNQLSCVSISGEMSEMQYLFDFALWNPHAASACEGYFARWEAREPFFHHMSSERATIARDRLAALHEKVHDPSNNGVYSCAGITVRLEQKGSLN